MIGLKYQASCSLEATFNNRLNPLRGLAGRPVVAMEGNTTAGTNKVGRCIMKRSIKDQAKGMLHEVKGEVKEVVGKVTHNTSLENRGRDEKTSGKIQKKVGDFESHREKK
jgi:uncharacterized protein YjbJ (UPF0337 family)